MSCVDFAAAAALLRLMDRKKLMTVVPPVKAKALNLRAHSQNTVAKFCVSERVLSQ